jgi:hypothetical protein
LLKIRLVVLLALETTLLRFRTRCVMEAFVRRLRFQRDDFPRQLSYETDTDTTTDVGMERT